MTKTKVFCFGFGQVAESFINKLINEKKDFDLSVTYRQETHQIEFNNIKINVKNVLYAVTHVSKLFYPTADIDKPDQHLKDFSKFKFLSKT